MKKTIILYFCSLLFTLLFVFWFFVEREFNGSLRNFIFNRAYDTYWSDSDYFATKNKFNQLIDNDDKEFIKGLHKEYGNNITYEKFKYLLKIDKIGLTRYENSRFNWAEQKRNTRQEIRQKYIDSGLIDPNANDFMSKFAENGGQQIFVVPLYSIGGLIPLVLYEIMTYID